MKKLSTLLIAVALCCTAFAQPDLGPITDSIRREGLALYKCEMASWYGTDIFMERFKDLRQKAGGYFSYYKNDQATCIFYSKEEKPKVLASFTFDSTYDVSRAQVDATERAFTTEESELYTLRKLASDDIYSDTLYKSYKNTNLNLIPLVSYGQKKVYVLTGPSIGGVVVIGNDYLITFDNDNKIVSRRRLHKNIIPIEYGKNTEGQAETGMAMHSHLPETGDFITATDICTLMLYAKYAKWEQHIVISEKYVSIWYCDKNSLLVLTRDAWEKIYKTSEKEKKKQE
ncbi:MAG TPA: hypothetical protein VD993_01040 [Chitinophagaceae bacterium]|nr:hypothetical protein [Chitinophagaceae bacterium]